VDWSAALIDTAWNLAAIVAILVGFPGARWTLPTFGVAFLPGLALATALSAMGTRRG